MSEREIDQKEAQPGTPETAPKTETSETADEPPPRQPQNFNDWDIRLRNYGTR